jgi:DNA-binding transcriptional LysR family regulator
MEYKNLPELSGWAALRAIVEKGGVNEAAKALHIGQPAITKRLRALEASYGVPLTERVGGRLRLTSAGERVYQLAVHTLDRQLILREELMTLAQGKKSLQLETTSSIGEHLLPDLLLAFAEQYPLYKVSTRMRYSRQIQAHLAAGVADLALLEIAPDHPDILVQKWMDDELWLVCGARHPLADAGMIAVEKLRDLSFVLRERNAASREVMEAALRGIGIEKLKVALEIGSGDAIMEILMRGRHVSFLPRFSVEDRVRRGRLVRLKVEGFRIQRTLWIARNRKSINHPVAEAFIKLLRDSHGPRAAGG